MQETVRGRKNDFQSTGVVSSGGVRVWEIKGIGSFFGSEEPGHHPSEILQEAVGFIDLELRDRAASDGVLENTSS